VSTSYCNPAKELRDAIISLEKYNKMKKEKDFWIANENAKVALNELMFDAKKVKWLRKYQKLFNMGIV